MKPFNELNYYELLEIKPDATREEVERAYREAVEMYSPGNKATYGLFSPEEREEISSIINAAYNVLSHEESRRMYNIKLFGGDIPTSSEKMAGPDAREFILKGDHIFKKDIKEEPIKSFQDGDGIEKSEPDISWNEVEKVDGGILKQMRTDKNILLEDISGETKIGIRYLKAIEENNLKELPPPAYLKGFIKQYLKYLKLDAERFAEKYMKFYHQY